MSDWAAELAEALALHERGELAHAEEIYRRILAASPNHADALNLLGMVHFQREDYAAAEGYLRRAIAQAPAVAVYHGNLGLALRKQGRVDEAVACFQRALALNPGYAVAHCNLGNAWQQQGRLADAVACYRRSVEFRPDFAIARANLAAAEFEWGVKLHLQGELAEAAACYERALAINPETAAVWSNLGDVLRQQGKLTKAATCCRRALAIDPRRADACNNLGCTLQEQRQLDDAIRWFNEALALAPGTARTHNNLANALMDQGRLNEAIPHYRECVRLAPELFEFHSNLLFCLAHDPNTDLRQLLREHMEWGSKLGSSVVPIVPHDRDRSPDRRLRVGYLSADFWNHAVARFITPVLRSHDPAQFEVFCYSQSARSDAVTAELQALAQHWRNIRMLDDDALAERIREDRIDVLVELSGHTSGNRLAALARKPAPVLATYLGYPLTTGLGTVDYRISDAVMDPPSADAQSTEQVVRLPRVCCFEPQAAAPDVSALPAHRNGFITFGSLHRLSKLNESVLDLWARVLSAIPTSRLLMARDSLHGARRDAILARFENQGVSAERVELRSQFGNGGHLTVFQEIDIGLDTFPYNGGTISCESLWMGVPLVTLCGDRAAARAGASLLHTVGLNAWIAHSPEEYISIAVQAAADVDRLVSVRSSLRQKMRETICEHVEFTRTLESTYRQMWRTWCAGS